jgi:Bardet-Biedl syndrome 4 protein
MLHATGSPDEARVHLHQYRALWEDLEEGAKNSDPELLEQSAVLGNLLGM